MVLRNLWMSVGDVVSPAAAAAADVRNMKQSSRESFPPLGFILLRRSTVGLTESPL